MELLAGEPNYVVEHVGLPSLVYFLISEHAEYTE
jgi:hypothetical protein